MEMKSRSWRFRWNDQEEQVKRIQEKEQKIKDLDLEKRTAQLELKKHVKK